MQPIGCMMGRALSVPFWELFCLKTERGANNSLKREKPCLREQGLEVAPEGAEPEDESLLRKAVQSPLKYTSLFFTDRPDLPPILPPQLRSFARLGCGERLFNFQRTE